MAIDPDEMTITDRELPPEEQPVEPEWTPEGEGERPPCQEPGCYKPCRKRRNAEGFLPYCSEHNKLHAPTVTTPGSRSPNALNAARSASAKKIEQSLIGWGSLVQAGLLANGDVYCGWALGQEVPHIAKATGEVAQDFPWLKNLLETGDKWGSLSVLFFHLAKLGTMIAVHHGVIPYEGVVKFLAPNPQPPTGPAGTYDMRTPAPEPVAV